MPPLLNDLNELYFIFSFFILDKDQIRDS